MQEYHKINSVYKRDEHKQIIEGDYSTSEIKYLKDSEWEFTEKIDGTNIRVFFIADASGKSLRFGGRTNDAQMSIRLYEYLQTIFTIEKISLAFSGLIEKFDQSKIKTFFSITLYGEGLSKGIKSSGNYIDKNNSAFYLFDIVVRSWDDVNGTIDWWLERVNVNDIANKLDIIVVPVVGQGTLEQACELVKNGFTSTYGNFIAEGLVMRPTIQLFDRKGNLIITKIKTKDFKNQNAKKNI